MDAKQLMKQFVTTLDRPARTIQRVAPVLSRMSEPPEQIAETLRSAEETLRPRDAEEPDVLQDALTAAVSAFETALRPVFGNRSARGGKMRRLIERWRIRR